MLNIVLVQPEIPANTGNIARTCAATGCVLHLVKPLGFDISDKAVKRAGLDYWHLVDVRVYENLEDFFQKTGAKDLWLLSTKAPRAYTQAAFHDGCWLFFGKETKGLPEELLDCAKIDGASEFRIFTNIILPLSKSVMSVLTVYFAIGYWNSYFPSVLYHGDSSLHPLGMYVRKLVIQNSILNTPEDLLPGGTMIDPESILSNLQLKYTVICIAVLPLIMNYPFFSKYMKKGLMVGSLKG